MYRLVDPSIDSTFKFLFADFNLYILENILKSIDFSNSPKLIYGEISKRLLN